MIEEELPLENTPWTFTQLLWKHILSCHQSKIIVNTNFSSTPSPHLNNLWLMACLNTLEFSEIRVTGYGKPLEKLENKILPMFNVSTKTFNP